MNPLTYLREIASACAGAGAAILVMLVVYEGVPIGPLASIPWLGPKLELITGGRVDRQREDARRDFVAKAELASAKAKLAEIERQLEASRRATEGYAVLLAEAQAREAEQDAENQQKDADYEAKLRAAGRSWLFDDVDVRWLREP